MERIIYKNFKIHSGNDYETALKYCEIALEKAETNIKERKSGV